MLLAEYAIDPQALSTWETFRYVADQCGVSKGRLISNFPDNWCREVLKSTDQCRPVARARIVEKLKQLKNSALVNLYRDFDLQKNWQTNALSSHEQMEFRAIIAKNPQDALILDVDLLDESVDAWRVERERAVRRNSGELSAAASYLLMMAQEVMFVDPYFSAEDRRCRKPIIAFLNNMLFPVRRLECHLSSRTSGSAEHFKDVLERFIIPDLRRISEWPSEQPFFFIRWNQRQSGDGEAFHPRYILTDKGGLRFEHGLAEGEDNETTDVSLLDEALYLQRRGQYKPDSTCFQFVDGWCIQNGEVSPVAIKDGEWMKD